MNDLKIDQKPIKNTAQKLRQQNSNKKHGERQPCFACGGHKSITHLHHVVSLKDCADMFNDNFTNEISVPMIWLCPNCHAYIHNITDHGAYMEPINENEHSVAEKFAEILKIRDDAISKILEPFWEEFIRKCKEQSI